jgi:hypothetical protein
MGIHDSGDGKRNKTDSCSSHPGPDSGISSSFSLRFRSSKILENASAFSFDHDEPQSEAEVDLLSGFLQECQDWGDLDIEAGERVKTAYRLTGMIQELENEGFWVFGFREIRQLEGGAGSPSAFPVAILRILRSTNQEIIQIGTEQEPVPK